MGFPELIVLALMALVAIGIIALLKKLYHKHEVFKWISFIAVLALSLCFGPLISLIFNSNIKSTLTILAFSMGYFPMLTVAYLMPRWKNTCIKLLMILLTLPVILIPFFKDELSNTNITMNVFMLIGGASAILTIWIRRKIKINTNNNSNTINTINSELHAIIDGFLISSDDELIIASKKMIQSNIDKIELEIKKNKQTPSTIAHNVIFELSKKQITSGKYHTYRGVLSLPGSQYLAVHKKCVNWYRDNGYWNDEQVEGHISLLQKEINEVG